MNVKKGTTLLSLAIITSSVVHPHLIFATKVNEGDKTTINRSFEQTENKENTVSSSTVYHSDEESDSLPSVSPQSSSTNKFDLSTAEIPKSSEEESQVSAPKPEISTTTENLQPAASDDIATGTFGTAPWRIDAQGVLHIEAGNFISTTSHSPWIAYKDQITKVSFEGKVIAARAVGRLFEGLSNMVSVENINNLDCSQAAGGSWMFNGCASLIELDLSQTGAKFLSSEGFFKGCTNLEKLNISGVRFDINADDVFRGDSSLSQLTVDENFGFDRSDLQGLPTPSGVGYTGKWINVGDGTIDNPQGESILTSTELVGMTRKKVADTYVWQRAVPAAPVTLHYVDQDGNAIPGQDDVTLTGFYEGDTIPFADNTPTISGYTLDTAHQPDSTSKFTTAPQTFNIPYTRNQGTAVNVRYVDENGTSISGHDTQITGFENETKSTDPYKIDIPGYTLDETKLPASEVTLTASAQPDIVFSYKQNPGSITLKYEDEQGQALAEGQTLEDDVTTPFTAEDYKLDISGYYLTSLPTNVTQFTSDPQTAVYKYAVDQTALDAHDKLLYVGEDWKAADTFDSITSEDGTKTTVLPSDVIVDGRVDTSKVGDYTVTYTWTNPQTNKRVSKSIVIHVVDKSAILVHDSTLTVGDAWTAQDNFDSALNKKGDKIPFDQIKVDGTVDTSKAGTYKVTYSYDETATPQVMKAEVGASHRGTTTVTATITVKDKAPVDPGNPGKPTSPTTPSQPDKPSGSGNTNTNTSGNTTVNVSNYGEDSKTSNKTLPETGEENNSSFIVYGLGILAALLGFITYRGIRRKN